MGIAAHSSFTKRGIRERQADERRERAVRMREHREADIRAREERRVRDWFFAASYFAANLADAPEMKPRARRRNEDIIKAVSLAHGVLVHAIKGKVRAPKIVAARHHAMHEVRRLCWHLTYEQIAGIFGCHHSSVHHGVSSWPAKAAALGMPCVPVDKRGAS